MNAVDTNIWLYSVDHFEPVKRQQAVNLLEQLSSAPEPVVLLWQVAGEYMNGLRRWANQGRLDVAYVEQYLEEALAQCRMALPTEAVLSRSLSLYSRYSLSHWDSMLLAACVDAGVDTLYSEDLAAGMTYDTVTVINPFA
jgi:predicted nucleic acid-binding protein